MAGLSYICNKNYSITDFDFYVSNNSGAISGIRSFQGTPSYPAQNVFSNTGPSGTFTDFNNTTSNPINYYYNQPLFLPAFFNTPLVSPMPTASTNACPSHICPPPCDIARLLSTLEEEQLTERYDSAEMGYLNLLYSYNQLLDGGNTNVLLDSMQLSWSDNALILRDELLAQSPYLSQEVLMEVAREDILPPAMLLMICLANPDATRRIEFLDFLQYEIPTPLPQYMINLIMSSWDNVTARTTMENFLADFNLEMAVVSNQILADLQHKMANDIDSISQGDTTNNICKLKSWLNRIQTLSAKYNLIEVYFSERDFINAELQLSQIPLDFTLSEYQSQEYTDYIFFYNFRKALIESGADLSQLDNPSIESLILFSQGERNLAKGLAQNALCFYYDICPEEIYALNSGNRMMNTNSPSSLNLDAKKMNASVYVTPNPASSYTSIIYNISPMSSPAVLVIRDIAGREEEKFNLTESTDQLYWDTSNVLSGIYYYSLIVGHTNLSSGKIVVKR
ncbi:MAG: T9SS type A sorting domain-containing protein [Bacteroidetes bacterium]|nr:T9SS type A sorting domain-containing protein [Bacteroidota bacterium]